MGKIFARLVSTLTHHHQLHVTPRSRGQVITWKLKKSYISISTRAVATKLDREHSRKRYYLQSHITCGLRVQHQVTWQKKRYISISTRPVATKLDRILGYDKEPQTSKLHVSPITGSRELTCKIKNFLFPLSRGLMPLNLTGWWFEKGSPSKLAILHNSQVTNKKHYIFISTRLVAIKLVKVMACSIGSLRTESYMFLWPRDHMLSQGN